MTLMQWGNSEGVKGRCDAKCHNAKSAKCHCMCGGRYHGGRHDGTLEQRVQEHGAEILQAAKARCRAEGYVLRIPVLGKLVPAFGDLPLIEATIEAPLLEEQAVLHGAD